MAKYVDADTIVEKLWPVDPENDGSDGCTVVLQNLTFTSADLESLLDEIPAADVVEVVHAKWEFNGICTSCSACGSNKPTKAHDHKLASREVRFCYFCGAKMDLEESK